MYAVTFYVSPYFPKETFVTDDIAEALQFLREWNVKSHWQIVRKSDGVVIAQLAHRIVKSID